MLETEEVLNNGSIETVLYTIENMLRNVTQKLLDKNHSDLEAIKKIQTQQKNNDCKVVEYEVQYACQVHFCCCCPPSPPPVFEDEVIIILWFPYV